MIPLIATLQYNGPSKRKFRLWIPLFLIWIFLLPLFLILLPFFFIGCFIMGFKAFQTLGTFNQILASLKGTEIEVAHFNRTVLIRIP